MSRNILCAVYLLIAISTVHSASYYFRAGREVIVPTIEEVKEVISELKKEEPVVVEEILSIQPDNVAAPVVAEAVPIVPETKSVPETVVPVVENTENNVVVEPEPVVVSQVSDEARAKPNPLLRLDTIEVIQPGVTPEKVATVAETVKIAAVQAIEKEEIAKAAEPVVQPAVVEPSTETKDESVVKSVPVVENVDASVKIVETAPVVPAVVPIVEKVEKVEKVESVEPVQESVRSADPEPVKPEPVVVKEESVEVPKEVVKDDVKAAEKSVEEAVEKTVEKGVEVPAKEVRQQAAQPGPLDVFTNTISNTITNLQTAFQNALQAPLNIIRPPQAQSDATAPAASETTVPALNTAEVAPAVATNAAVPATPLASSTTAPNFLQNVQNAINSIPNAFTSILRPTTAPAAPAVAPVEPAPVIVSGTRGGDESVEVVQNIEVDINDKVDLAQQKSQ